MEVLGVENVEQHQDHPLHNFTIRRRIGELETFFCARCADWLGCYGDTCETVFGDALSARIGMWVEQIKRAQERKRPPEPPKPRHVFSIVRGRGPFGQLLFCPRCGCCRDFDDEWPCEQHTPGWVAEQIEARIATVQIGLDGRRRHVEQPDQIPVARRFDLNVADLHESNISAAINNVVGGWNRREP